MNSSISKESKRNLIIATSILGGVTSKDCELISVFIQEILLLNNFTNFKLFFLTLNSKLPKSYTELTTLPFLLYQFSMKNATRNSKPFFYELPQSLKSPIDDYFLFIISNGELEFDERISNLKKLHPNLISFVIQIGPNREEYQSNILKIGFEGRFYLKKYSELRSILHYVRKALTTTARSNSELIDLVNKFSTEHEDSLKSIVKKGSTDKVETTVKNLGNLYIVDSGLEFLGNFISAFLQEIKVKWELLGLTEIKKIDFDCENVLLFFNSTAVLDPKKPIIIESILEKFGSKMKIAYFEAPSSSINENGYKLDDDKVPSTTFHYEKKRFAQTYPVVDENNLPMTHEEVAELAEFIKSTL